MKNKRRAALKQLKDFQENGGDVSKLQIKDEVLYTGSETFTVTLDPKIPGEKLLLDTIKALPSRRRGPRIRDLAVQAVQGQIPAMGRSINVGQSAPTFDMPVAGAHSSKSALDKMDEGWG